MTPFERGLLAADTRAFPTDAQYRVCRVLVAMADVIAPDGWSCLSDVRIFALANHARLHPLVVMVTLRNLEASGVLTRLDATANGLLERRYQMNLGRVPSRWTGPEDRAEVVAA